MRVSKQKVPDTPTKNQHITLQVPLSAIYPPLQHVNQSSSMQMRPHLLTLLLTSLPRASIAHTHTHTPRILQVPSLEHPTCRRTFTCAAPSRQDFSTIMADMAKKDRAEVNRLAEPCERENEILDGNPARDAALKKAEEAKVEQKLPKLSAAEFRVYNSMAEHMEYFVRISIYLCIISIYIKMLSSTKQASKQANKTAKLTIHTLIPAQPFPPVLDNPQNGLRHQPAPEHHVPESLPLHGPLLSAAPGNAPLDRRGAHLPGAGAQDARVHSREGW